MLHPVFPHPSPLLISYKLIRAPLDRFYTLAPFLYSFVALPPIHPSSPQPRFEHNSFVISIGENASTCHIPAIVLALRLTSPEPRVQHSISTAHSHSSSFTRKAIDAVDRDSREPGLPPLICCRQWETHSKAN